MRFIRHDNDEVLAYARNLKLTAELDPADGKSLIFKRLPPIPDRFSPAIRQVLDICIEYHQRCVFMGEYLKQDKSPPYFKADSALEEINFYLEHYKAHFIKEVDKGLADSGADDDAPPKLKLSPYAEAMLKHRHQQRKKT
jgi:hypothetical protein